MLENVFVSPWFRFICSLFDNIFVFQFASTLLMTANTVFSIRLLFHNVVVLWFISSPLETAISNVDCTLVEMECSFEEQFQFYLEVCACCRTAKWKGESIMLDCDWLPFVSIRSLTLRQHFRLPVGFRAISLTTQYTKVQDPRGTNVISIWWQHCCLCWII